MVMPGLSKFNSDHACEADRQPSELSFRDVLGIVRTVGLGIVGEWFVLGSTHHAAVPGLIAGGLSVVALAMFLSLIVIRDRGARWMIGLAVLLLPADARARWSEEWEAELAELQEAKKSKAASMRYGLRVLMRLPRLRSALAAHHQHGPGR